MYLDKRNVLHSIECMTQLKCMHMFKSNQKIFINYVAITWEFRGNYVSMSYRYFQLQKNLLS